MRYEYDILVEHRKSRGNRAWKATVTGWRPHEENLPPDDPGPIAQEQRPERFYGPTYEDALLKAKHWCGRQDRALQDAENRETSVVQYVPARPRRLSATEKIGGGKGWSEGHGETPSKPPPWPDPTDTNSTP